MKQIYMARYRDIEQVATVKSDRVVLRRPRQLLLFHAFISSVKLLVLSRMMSRAVTPSFELSLVVMFTLLVIHISCR